MTTTDIYELFRQQARQFERQLTDMIANAAREQEAFTSAGESPFALDWVAIRDAIPASQPRSRFKLRSAGIHNLEGEVHDLVGQGLSSSYAIHARLIETHGDIVEPQQIHRALHKLTSRNALQRIGRNKYVPTEGATLKPT